MTDQSSTDQLSTANEEKQSALMRHILASLFNAYQIDPQSIDVFEALPADRDHLSVADILNIMARLGYTSSSFETRACDIELRLFPCIFVKDDFDIRVICEPCQDKSSGQAFVFNKEKPEDIQEQRKMETAAGVGWMHGVITRFADLIILITIISFLLNIVALAFPFFIIVIYDWIGRSVTKSTIEILCYGLFLTLLMEVMLRVLRARALSWFSTRVDNMVGNKSLSHLLQLPAYAVERASVSSQVARLKSFEMARDFFTSSLFLTLLDVPFTFLAFICLFFIGGVLGYIPVISLVISVGCMIIFQPKLKLAMLTAARARGDAQSGHTEVFEKIESIRLNGLDEILTKRFREQSAKNCFGAFYVSFYGQALESLAYVVGMIGAVSIIGIGAQQAINGEITSGTLFACLILYWRIMGPWQALYSNMPRLQQVASSFQQIDKLFQIQTEKETSTGFAKPKTVLGSLSFSNVGLRYTKNADPICVGLSFDIEQGMLATLAGQNGSGKTTILKLALGLYKPQAGAIFLDRQDIRQIDCTFLRRSIGYLPQFPEIFNGTVAENVRYGNPLASDKEVWNALELADASDFVSKLSDGINTRLDKRDPDLLRAMLDVKISLARTYVKDAPIYLFDELPFTLLSSEAGKRLTELLKSWHGRKTVLMVSHRDDYIMMADKTIGLLNERRYVFDKPEKVLREIRNDAFLYQRRFA